MIIDISELLRKKIIKKNLNMTFDIESFSDKGETIEVSAPVNLLAVLTSVGDIICLDGTVSTKLKLICSRCLENFSYDINIELHEKFSNSKVDIDNNDDDIIFIDSDIIDITQIIQNNIIAALPIKRLCNDDCRGLCQHCGANLNFSACECEKENIDPRLAKLKDMFSTD